MSQEFLRLIDNMKWDFTIDNPGVFSNIVGDDLYVNPWWALRKRLNTYARTFVDCMDRTLGQPDLWFNGLYHELLWGPRDLPRLWRPSFHANLSGHSGTLYCSFWLPWRAGANENEAIQTSGRHKGMPMAANVLDYKISLSVDVFYMEAYFKEIPKIRELIKVHADWDDGHGGDR